MPLTISLMASWIVSLFKFLTFLPPFARVETRFIINEEMTDVQRYRHKESLIEEFANFSSAMLVLLACSIVVMSVLLYVVSPKEKHGNKWYLLSQSAQIVWACSCRQNFLKSTFSGAALFAILTVFYVSTALNMIYFGNSKGNVLHREVIKLPFENSNELADLILQSSGKIRLLAISKLYVDELMQVSFLFITVF